MVGQDSRSVHGVPEPITTREVCILDKIIVSLYFLHQKASISPSTRLMRLKREGGIGGLMDGWVEYG